MKKSFIALAVAGASVAPMTASAVEVTYSGTVNTAIVLGSKSDEKVDGVKTDLKNQSAHVVQNDVQFGVKVTEDVGFAEAFGSLRIDVDSLSGGGNASYADNVAVGLSGGFGTVTIGEATDYAESGQLAADTIIDSDSSANGTPNAAVSYDMPTVIPGLTAGVNLITTTYDGVNETQGASYGLSYTADFGDAGALVVGYGANDKTVQNKTVNTAAAGGSLVDGTKDTYKYNSFGVKYTIFGISLAYASQAQKRTVADIEYEPITVTDIKLGYSSGPLSAYFISSGALGVYKGSDTLYDDATDGTDQELKSGYTRIHVSYQLSDAVSTHFRVNNQTADAKYDAASGGVKRAFNDNLTRVGLGISF